MLSLFQSLDGNKGKTIDENCVKDVLDTLGQFLQDDCSAGSENLILLQKSNSDGLTPLETRIQFTVGALRLHKGNVQIQCTACKCLSNFAISAEIVAQLISAEALPLVMEALERFWWDADLQRAACSAMWNIARNNEARAILGVKAAKAIFNTLELHKGSDFVQEAALGSLANLAPNADVQNHLCTKDKLHVIFLSMYTHQNCDLLQTAACGLLNNLAHGDKHALTIGQMGGIRLIVTAMKRHNHNGKLLRNACAALANLSTEAKNFNKLLRAKALESLFYAYHLCPEDVPSLQDMARAALTNMGVRDLAFKTTSIHLAALNARGSLDAIIPMMEGKHTALYGDRRQFTFEENEDINALDSEQNTPLHLAVERRDAEVTKLLIGQGADMSLENKYGHTVLQLVEKAIAEDEKKKAEGAFELKSEDDDPDEKVASGEDLKKAVVAGKQRFKILKGIFADLIAKTLPDVPEDVAFLLADFAHMSDFTKYVSTAEAFNFENTEKTWKSWANFRKFLKRDAYSCDTPKSVPEPKTPPRKSNSSRKQSHTISPLPPPLGAPGVRYPAGGAGARQPQPNGNFALPPPAYPQGPSPGHLHQGGGGNPYLPPPPKANPLYPPPQGYHSSTSSSSTSSFPPNLNPTAPPAGGNPYPPPNPSMFPQDPSPSVYNHAGAGGSMLPNPNAQQPLPGGWRQSWFDQSQVQAAAEQALAGEESSSSSTGSTSSFRKNKPPPLSIIPDGMRKHCRRMSQTYPDMKPIYEGLFGDGVIDLTDDEESEDNKDAMEDAEGGQKRKSVSGAQNIAPRKTARGSSQKAPQLQATGDSESEEELSEFERWLATRDDAPQGLYTTPM